MKLFARRLPWRNLLSISFHNRARPSYHRLFVLTDSLIRKELSIQICSRQVELLKGRLSHFANVEVSSIDGFHGREVDIVVFITVRGFLKDVRQMNIALTQAQAAVIVIGHRATAHDEDRKPREHAGLEKAIGCAYGD